MTLQLLTCLSHSEPTRSDVHVSPPSYLSLACNGEAFTSQKGILAADPAPNNSFKGKLQVQQPLLVALCNYVP